MTSNPDGTIRHRHPEMAYESLHPTLRTIAASMVGETPVRQVAEIYEDGRTVYRVLAKLPNQGIQVVLAPDGKVLRAEVQRPERAP